MATTNVQNERVCPACHVEFKSITGRNSHLSQSRKCAWYNRQLFEFSDDSETEEEKQRKNDTEDIGDADIDNFGDDDYNLENGINAEEGIVPAVQTVTRPLAADPQETGEPLSKKRRVDETSTVHDYHPVAGKIFRIDESVQDASAAYAANIGSGAEPKYGPFISETDWEIAHWLIDDDLGKSRGDRFMSINTVPQKLELSFDSMDKLYEKVEELPFKAEWIQRKISLVEDPTEEHDIEYRDIVAAIKSLWSDPLLADQLVTRPEKMYADETRQSRLYNEFWTGQWWWKVQSSLHVDQQDHTIVAVIISTDKTQLTQFSNKNAYPVYLTLGNIPRATRRKPSQRASILIGCLSTEKITTSGLSDEAKCVRMHRLYHESMKIIMEPLIAAGKEGIELTNAKGEVVIAHPILACCVADYPEQCLLSGSKYNSCPKCYTGKSQLGELYLPIPAPPVPPNPPPVPGNSQPVALAPLRTQQKTLDSIDTALNSTRKFHLVCREKVHGMSGYVPDPFWADLPYTDIHLSITPDVLHQLYSGVFKHLLEWCTASIKSGELDDRVKRLPPSHGIRHFNKGFSVLSNITGSERKQMAKILLGCLMDGVPTLLIRICRALLEFIYLAQYSSHSNETLDYLKEALEEFHEHKNIVIRLKCRDNFYLPKLHSLIHYLMSIKLFGATDNYNTEMFERLHAEYVKPAYRATNGRDERLQMLKWYTRKERIEGFKSYLKMRDAEKDNTSAAVKTKDGRPFVLAKRCPNPNKSLELIERTHDAKWLSYYLKVFLKKSGAINYPGNRQQTILDYDLPFDKINVWTLVKIRHKDIQGLDNDKQTEDSFHATPSRPQLKGTARNARFDTILVDTETRDKDETGLEGSKVGRARVVFTLPERFIEANNKAPKEHLVYVEWFKIVRNDAISKLYEVKKQRETGNAEVVGEVVRLSAIRQSIQLIPKFGKKVNREWKSETVLDQCEEFYINNFGSLRTYQAVY